MEMHGEFTTEEGIHVIYELHNFSEKVVETFNKTLAETFIRREQQCGEKLSVGQYVA